MTDLEPKEVGGPIPPPIYTLSSIHSPEVHNHEPDPAKHIADHIMQLMKDELAKNPSIKIGKLIFHDINVSINYFFAGPMAEKIIYEETLKYQDNQALQSRILDSLPTNRLSTLYSHRKTLPGYNHGRLCVTFVLA